MFDGAAPAALACFTSAPAGAFFYAPYKETPHDERAPASNHTRHAQSRTAHPYRRIAGAEKELIFALAERNGVALRPMNPWNTCAAPMLLRICSLFDIYYAGASVLLKEQDFYDMTRRIWRGRKPTTCLHTEIFFDPQTHTARGVPMAFVIDGIHRACQDSPVSATLILSFLRHLSEEDAFETLARRCRTATSSSASASTLPRSATRRRSSRGCSRAAASWASMSSPTPARKARRPISRPRSTCSKSSASTTACAAWRTRR